MIDETDMVAAYKTAEIPEVDILKSLEKRRFGLCVAFLKARKRPWTKDRIASLCASNNNGKNAEITCKNNLLPNIQGGDIDPIRTGLLRLVSAISMLSQQ